MKETTLVAMTPIPQIICENPKDLPNIYSIQGKPVIVKGVINNWSAFPKWNLDYFKSKYGQLDFVPSLYLPEEGVPFENIWRDHHRAMKLGEFVDYLPLAERPCYIHRQAIGKFPGAIEDIDFDEIFQGNTHSSESFMWIGSAGTRTGLHFDYQDTMLCQFYGTKQITMVSPADSKLVYPYYDSITKSRLEPENPDLEKYPDFAKATVYQGTIGPGEMLYIPKHWWHSVISLEHSISLSHNYGDKLRLMDFLDAINAAGVFGWLSVARDFIYYGVLRRNFKTRLFDDPPFGKLLYDMVASAIRRRLHA